MTQDTLVADVVLRDGSTVCLRHAEDSDLDPLRTFLSSLSRDSQYFRLLGRSLLNDESVRHLVPVDRRVAAALVVETAGRIVGFAGFYRSSPTSDRAEVAFAVDDAL